MVLPCLSVGLARVEIFIITLSAGVVAVNAGAAGGMVAAGVVAGGIIGASAGVESVNASIAPILGISIESVKICHF